VLVKVFFLGKTEEEVLLEKKKKNEKETPLMSQEDPKDE
jgi:hypothetical protein